MSEYAVEYGVQIQPVEIFWIVLIEPQQVAGLIKQDLTIRSQHPAALVRGGGQGTERYIQKAEVQIQPAAHHRQHLAAHACLPLLVGLRPLGLERLARVKKIFLFGSFGAKVSPHLEPSQPRCKLPQSSLRDASPLRWGLWRNRKLTLTAKGFLLEGAGARSAAEGVFCCLKIKIVPLLFGLRSILFVLRIRQQSGGSGVPGLGGKAEASAKRLCPAHPAQ